MPDSHPAPQDFTMSLIKANRPPNGRGVITWMSLIILGVIWFVVALEALGGHLNELIGRLATNEGAAIIAVLVSVPLLMLAWMGNRASAIRELDAARTLLVDAIEASDHGIILHDSDDRIVLFNHRFLEHLSGVNKIPEVGQTFEEGFRAAVHQGYFEFPPELDVEAFIAQRLERRRSGKGYRFLRRQTDGRVCEVWESRTRNGGTVTMTVDVTNRIQIEKQLIYAQRMEAVGQLTGGIAHDFNNLLAVLSVNLDMIEVEQPDGRPFDEFLEPARNAVKLGASLTHRLLAFARKQPLNPVVTDIGNLVRQMMPLVQSAVGKAVVVSTSFDPDPCFARIDPGQLECAILNLASNSRDAMEHGGQLSIEVGIVSGENTMLSDGAIDLRPERHVLIKITDTGCGIPTDVLPPVCEPFFSTKDVGKGTGLGLSMVFGFVKQSGGHINITSEPGVSTSVSIYLPRFISPVKVHVPSKTVVVQKVALSNSGDEITTILLVDDDPDLRRSCAMLLGSMGYRVFEAADADEALACLNTQPQINILFSDIILANGMNGVALATEVRRRWPALAIILTSGIVDAMRKDLQGLPSDIVILSKPYSEVALDAAIRDALPLRARHPADI